ncbi:MAG: DUF308 domain-containing protein [Pseudomonadota bacterium]|nr:DUF308 domain-containing protein [Pseudomonadota bacterium]
MTGTFNDFQSRMERDVRDHRTSYALQGILFIVLGGLAAILPGAVALGVELLIGAILLVSGIVQFVLSLHARIHWWSLASAILSVAIGLFMLWEPFAGLLALITVIAIFLTAEGIFELLLAFQFRPVRRWGWMLFAGIVTLILAALLWAGWPGLGVFYIGWIVAINLILYGVALIMLAGHATTPMAR